jgi:hypothetical protein
LAPIGQPIVDTGRQRGVRRPRAQFLIVASVLLAVASCTTGPHTSHSARGSGGSPEPVAFEVPWIARPAQPFVYIAPRTSEPSLRSARPCQHNDIIVEPAQSSGISQTGDFSVGFRNISGRACWLRGYPSSVTAISAAGRARRLSLPHISLVSANGLLAPMRPGATTYLGVDTGTACADSSSRRATRYTRLVIAVAAGRFTTSTPGGGTIFVCGLGVHPFSIPAPTPDIAGTDAALVADIIAPPTVNAGGTLRYVVRLANLSRSPVPLASCPSYRELVATAGSGSAAQGDYQQQAGPRSHVHMTHPQRVWFTPRSHGTNLCSRRGHPSQRCRCGTRPVGADRPHALRRVAG